MNDSEKKIVDDSVGHTPLVPRDAKAARGQTANQDIETPVELMEFERHRPRVTVQSLYQRGRQDDDEFHNR